MKRLMSKLMQLLVARCRWNFSKSALRTNPVPPRTDWEEAVGLAQLYFPAHAKAVQNIIRPFFAEPLTVELAPGTSLDKTQILQTFSIWYPDSTNLIWVTSTNSLGEVRIQATSDIRAPFEKWKNDLTDEYLQRGKNFATEMQDMSKQQENGWCVIADIIKSRLRKALERSWANRYGAFDCQWFDVLISMQGVLVYWAVKAAIANHENQALFRQSAQAWLKGVFLVGYHQRYLLLQAAPRVREIKDIKYPE